MILLGILSTVAALALKTAFHRSRPAPSGPTARNRINVNRLSGPSPP
jgi:hypothetical protein